MTFPQPGGTEHRQVEGRNGQPHVAVPGELTAPVLVFGEGLTHLGVIRSLGRSGIQTYSIANPADFLVYSRWYHALPQASEAKPDPERLAKFLEGLPFERAVLMPCSDDWVLAVAGLPACLAKRFPTAMAPREVIEKLLDKWCLALWMQQERLPHPRTRLLQSPEMLEELSDEEWAGTFLKPRMSLEFNRRYKTKGCMVKDREEALQMLREFSASGFSVMLQEFVPGPPTAHYFISGFVDRSGRRCAAFVHHRQRMHPPRFGNSTCAVSEPLSNVSPAVETLDLLFSKIGYRGIFNAEFKYDSRDGLFKLLEVNTRPWWYVEFAVRCGVDVVQMAYRDALGFPVEPVQEYRTGRTCMHMFGDVMAYGELRRNSQANFWKWLSSWWRAEDAFLRWNDPGPALGQALAIASRGICPLRSRLGSQWQAPKQSSVPEIVKTAEANPNTPVVGDD